MVQKLVSAWHMNSIHRFRITLTIIIIVVSIISDKLDPDSTQKQTVVVRFLPKWAKINCNVNQTLCAIIQTSANVTPSITPRNTHITIWFYKLNILNVVWWIAEEMLKKIKVYLHVSWFLMCIYEKGWVIQNRRLLDPHHRQTYCVDMKNPGAPAHTPFAISIKKKKNLFMRRKHCQTSELLCMKHTM